jgi:hypothetical protein
VEKVRTNLLLQSNSFDTTWANFNSTETSGQLGYDGSNDAWLLQNTAASGSIRQTITSSGVQTYSFYAKAGTTDWVAAYVAGSIIPYCFFDLTNGVKGATQNNVINSSITAVGGGWYRIAISFDNTTADVRIFPAEANAVLASQVGDNIYIQDAQLEYGDIATDYLETTTSARSTFAGITVDGTSVPNVPRLDYSGVASCPSLLLEPQRTNLLTYSEQIDDASWGKAGATISANTSATLDPSGYNGSDKLVEDSSTGFHRTNKVTSLGGSVDSSPYCISIFAKAAGRTRFRFLDNSQNTSGSSYFDLSNGTVISGTGKIENYGNGWYRCTIFPLKNFSTNSNAIIGLVSTGTTESYTGDGTSGVFFWGAQLEAGSYATSYIPTLGSAVTRVAETAEKTGISSLIGQTEGTFYLNLNREGVSGTVSATFSINDGSNNNRMRILSTAGIAIRILFQLNGNVVQYDVSTTSVFVNAIDQQLKIAVAYKSGDIAVYINGQLFNASSNTLTFSAPLTNYELYDGANGLILSEALLFKTRLTNAQLAELTTL